MRAASRARAGEWPLVLFTVLAQAAVGVAVVAAFAPRPGLFPTALILFLAGGLAAAFHLGRVGRARLALSNLKGSWLSREVLLAGAFGAAVIAAVAAPGVPAIGVAAAVVGLVLVGAIATVYMIRTVPPWNTWMTPASFYLTAIVLGTSISAAALTHRVKEAGLLRVAAAAAGLQLLLAALHFARFGPPELKSLLPARTAPAIAGVAVALLSPEWATLSAVILLAASELVGRHLFYASHRRVGL
jgi:DMSO reductase anchor subunit